MGQGTPSVEPSILNSPPAVYHEWYKSQPRTRQCAEGIERLCMFLSGAAARISQIVCAVVRRDEPRPCAIPDALLDGAIECAQHAKDDAEQLIVRVRGVWTEIPSAVSFDPRGWKTDLLMRLEQARLDAGCVALTLSTRKGGWPVSVDEAREWKTVLWNHTGPLMERHRALKSIPAPASPGEASPNTDHGVANAIERAAELGAERAAEKVARVFGRGDNNDVKSPDRSAGAGASHECEPPDDAFLSEADIAKAGGVNQDTLRKHLPKWREMHHNNDWHRVENPRPRDPRYQYRWGSIKSLVQSIRRTANVPAKKENQHKAR